MKKGLALVVALIMIAGGAAIANEAEQEEDVLTPADATYMTGRLIEEAQHDLSEDFVEMAGQQNEFAERRMAALQRDEGREHALSLLKDMSEHEGRLSQALSQAMEALEENGVGESGDEFIELSERLKEATERRSKRLEELVKDEDMPEQAREGAQRALDNQERALEKAQQAIENARGGADKEDAASASQDGEQVAEEATDNAEEVPGNGEDENRGVSEEAPEAEEQREGNQPETPETPDENRRDQDR